MCVINMSLTPLCEQGEGKEEEEEEEEEEQELFRTARSSAVSAGVPVEEERGEEQRCLGLSQPGDAAAAATAAQESRRSVIPATPPEDEGCTCGRRSGEMKMKIRVCQGVGGIVLITTAASFMLVYNSSSGRRDSSSSSSSSASSSRRLDGPPVLSTEKPRSGVAAAALEGYTGVMDHKPLKMHCKTCALVTSSGHLIGSQRGREIDSFECVIRMNDAPVAGHWRDVGRRTSLRVVAHSSLQRVLRNRQELLNASQDAAYIFWGPSNSMRRDGKGQVYNNLRLQSQLLPRLRVFVISRLKMLKFDELFKRETGIDRKKSNSWLSTGWFTMAIALELCDRVNVFGMAPPEHCRSPSHPSVPYHYYEPSGPDECSMYLSHERRRRGGHHRFNTERAVFANWARTLDVHFYQPDWTPTSGNASSGFSLSLFQPL
ncbi:alpha-N-acetylgalactosaminide alpha-2,6-sialyltransferase 5b isoform X2 [Nelusetta ayraudi]|uniref:alpha-N-acetylgalactosaminide alpha-2,6-sialyltransferase 5b isoform X2 n=1 Tax=Nelusetta ayraudi TaxID=303726 RepID=UPI003F70EB6B